MGPGHPGFGAYHPRPVTFAEQKGWRSMMETIVEQQHFFDYFLKAPSTRLISWDAEALLDFLFLGPGRLLQKDLVQNLQ